MCSFFVRGGPEVVVQLADSEPRTHLGMSVGCSVTVSPSTLRAVSRTQSSAASSAALPLKRGPKLSQM